MKKITYLMIALLVFPFACDDEDFTPAQVYLDSPSFIATQSAESAEGGEVITFEVSVSDAPAGVDSIAVSTTNDLGNVTISPNGIIGQTKGQFSVSVEMPLIYSGQLDVSIAVFDNQLDEKTGEPARKSFSETLSVDVDFKFDAPSFSVSLADPQLLPGESTDVTVTVTAAPGGGVQTIVASSGAGTVELDETSVNNLLGNETGEVTGTFTASESPSVTGDVEVSVTVSDVTQQRSTTNSASVLVICGADEDISGDYNTYAKGSLGDGGDDYEALISTVTITQVNDGQFMVDDLTFGVYPELYGDTPVEGIINVCGSEISGFGVVDQYDDPFTITGTLPDEDVINGTIKIEWSNTFGDNGTVELVLQ